MTAVLPDACQDLHELGRFLQEGVDARVRGELARTDYSKPITALARFFEGDGVFGEEIGFTMGNFCLFEVRPDTGACREQLISHSLGGASFVHEIAVKLDDGAGKFERSLTNVVRWHPEPPSTRRT